MTVEACVPDDDLRSQVESILVVRTGEGAVRTLPPNTGPVLVFRFQGSISERLPAGERTVPRTALTGFNRSPRLLHYHPRSEILTVRFREGGAGGLLRAPMDEIAGTTRGLDDVMEPTAVHEIEDQLGEAPDDATRIRIVQDFLKSYLPRRPLDPLVRETIRRIRRSRGNVGIRELVRDLATNPDTLEKRFRRLVGATPKTFSRIVRFQSLVDGYSPEISLTEAALRAGFYDQAHLTREFRAFTGETPSAYFLHPRHW